MTQIPPVAVELSKLKIPYRIFRHKGPIRSLEQAARERNQEPGQVVRSLLFRLSRDEYLMVLVAGPQQVSWPALRHHVGESRLTMASRQEVKRVTGYEIGAVSPFGLAIPVKVLVDQSVIDQAEVSIGSGKRGTAIILKVKDLIRALNDPEVAQVST
jgi:Cys-tRNA(Pro)/Cys-tRNA(Cys) deacylase